MKKKITGGKYDKGTGTLEMSDGTTQCCGKCGCKRDWRRTAVIWFGIVAIIAVSKYFDC